jgi:hypothetical protein
MTCVETMHVSSNVQASTRRRHHLWGRSGALNSRELAGAKLLRWAFIVGRYASKGRGVLASARNGSLRLRHRG